MHAVPELKGHLKMGLTLHPFLRILNSAHPETVISPDICVMLKILSSEYQLYACGKIFRMP